MDDIKIIEGAVWDNKRFQNRSHEERGFGRYEAVIRGQAYFVWAHSRDEAAVIAETLTLCGTDVSSAFGAYWDRMRKGVDRTVTLILRDQDGMHVDLHQLAVTTALPEDEIVPAIKAAAQDYLNTEEGRKVYEGNCRCFNYGDFIEHVSNAYCVPHGFYKQKSEESVLIEEDFNTRLGDPEMEE